jgi:putative transcriptional regulator
MEIGNSLKVWRARSDITQDDLSKEVGLSRQTINSIENGKFVPTIVSALKIAKFFKVNVEEIFYLTEDKNEDQR